MATTEAGEFEGKLRRLEEIVQRLERENVGLDESVALFREGKTIAARCETLLRGAQRSIEAAARGEAQPPAAADAAPLFGRDVDDADPDL